MSEFKTRIQVLGVVGAVLLAVGTSLMLTKPKWIIESVFNGALLFSVGIFCLAFSLAELRNMRKGKVRWDERKEEIQVRAGYRAFKAFALIAGPLMALLALKNIEVGCYPLLGLLFAIVMLTYTSCSLWYRREM